MKRFFTSIGLIAAVAIWMGCDASSMTLNSYPPATLETAEDLKDWRGASAPNVYMASLVPLSIVELAIEFSGDAGCPTKTSDGTVETYQGGCTANGTTWIGTITVDGADAGMGSIHYNDFSMRTTEPCDGGTYVASTTFSGSLTQGTAPSGDSTFKVDLLMQGEGTDGGSCELVTASAAWSYEGTTNDAGIWTGKGRIGNSERGVVSAETVSEQVNDLVCTSEAASGTTTIQAGTHTAVITYDGASKCDSPGAVTWTLDGTSMGEVSGISCSAATGPAGLPGLALLVAGAVLWRILASRRSLRR